jgi:lysophospholipase L1-like esterase
MNRNRILILGTLIPALILAGCSLFAPDEEALTPPAVDSGTADFGTFVALGNSLTAGYQSGALYASTQPYGFAALLANALNVDFQLPLIADPGISSTVGIGHLQVVFDETGDAGLAPILWPDGMPALLNATLAAPYHNLGVPGAIAADLLNATDASTSASGSNSYFDIVLRNAAIDWTQLGAPTADLTAVGQAILLEPTFLSLWIGNNEILGAATAGVGGIVAGMDAATFTFLYRSIVTNLLAALPDLDMVVANIPPVTAAPYFTTIPWFVVDGDQMPVDGDPVTEGVQLVGLIAADAGPGQLESGDLVLLPLLSFDGDVSGVPDLNEGMGIPDAVLIGLLMQQLGVDAATAAGILNGPESPFPLHNTPIPGALTLIDTELAATIDATTALNDSIAAVAADNGIPLVDFHALLMSAIADANGDGQADGLDHNGVNYTTEFVTGGLFSLDGIHPSNVGYAIIAEEFARVINAHYNSGIGAPSLPEVPARSRDLKRVTSLPAGFPNLPR